MGRYSDAVTVPTTRLFSVQDELYSPERISTIGSYFGIGKAQIMAGEGHILSEQIVQELINNNLR